MSLSAAIWKKFVKPTDYRSDSEDNTDIDDEKDADVDPDGCESWSGK